LFSIQSVAEDGGDVLDSTLSRWPDPHELLIKAWKQV